MKPLSQREINSFSAAGESARRIARRRWSWSAAAAAAAALVLALVLYLLPTGGKTIDSIAVLPFVNVSADPNTEYLSDGSAEYAKLQ